MNVELDNEILDKIISDVYADIQRELKQYTRTLIFESLGITIDGFGHITKINDSLKNAIISQEKFQQLKDGIIENVNKYIAIKLADEGTENLNLECKYYNTRGINALIKRSVDMINKDIEKELEQEILEKLKTHHKPAIKNKVYSNPLIKQILLNKL